MMPLRDRLWLWFVRLALGCALGPGFGLAVLMAWRRAGGMPSGVWESAAIQIHAMTQLAGWGGAMILGIGLHFLPRLRGVKLAHPGWVAGFFWLLACGLVLRMGGQFLLAIPSGAGFVVPLGWMVAGGAFFQAVGVWGTLGVLVKTFRAGRPLEKNRGFLQIVPLLFVAGLSLAIAQGLWSVGAFEALRAGLPLVALPAHFEGAAVDLMLFGFVPAMALAMSSRLFPLTFGTRPPDSGALAVSAGLLACGVVLTVAVFCPQRSPQIRADRYGWHEASHGSRRHPSCRSGL